MSTHDTPTQTRTPLIRWAIPATAAVIGIGYLIAGLVGDDVGFGVFGLVLMVAVAAVFMWAGRHSETVAGLLDRNDERINKIDGDASLFAGMTILIAVIVMFIVEIARGQDGSPYYQLGALGGVSYIVALVWLRVRR